MPIYEYVCRHCGEGFERLQRMSDEPLTDCPACGESQLVKKVSAAAFRLKGGGWYETDFKSDGKRNLAGDGKVAGNSETAKSTSDNKSTTKATTTSDKKPAKAASKAKASDA